MTREPLRRLSTPPLPDSNLALSISSRSSADKAATHRESLSLDNAEHVQPTKPLKIHMHRRSDRDHSHGYSLLTPPLTPSSSLKTANTSESAANIDISSEYTHETHGDEADCQSTRFLILGNVSRQVQHDILRASIVETLTAQRVGAPNSPQSLSVPSCTVQGVLTEDSIKGVFLRCQQSNGIAILAFFDVRHAEVAKNIISVPTSGTLSHCVGDDLAEDGTRAWITCQFISSEQLSEVIGSSPFLTSTDASFYLAAEGKRVVSHDQAKELRVVGDHSFSDDDTLDSISICGDDAPALVDLIIDMLGRFLRSFGGLRRFSAAQEMDEKKRPDETIFCIEYYDVREAISAYTAVDNQILFGMKLRVFGREDLSESTKQRSQDDQPGQGSAAYSHITEKNGVPFPTTLAKHPSEVPVHIGYPGQFSQTRERFFAEGPHSRPRNSFQEREAFVNPFSGSPAPSPTYFYTSDPTIDSPAAGTSNDDFNRSDSDDALYSTNNRHNWVWDAGAHSGSAPGLYAHHDCYYCPSRGSPAASSPSSCYAPCSTPSPYCYQQDQRSSQNSTFPPVVIPAQAYGYQYDSAYPQPLTPTIVPNTANVAFEQAMMAAPRPQGGDLWFPQTPGTAPELQNLLYCSSQPSMAGGMPYVALDRYDSQPSPDPAFEIYHPNLPPASGSPHSRIPRSALVQGHSGSRREPRPSTEHNQLDLSRIEDGQDTRTTVMIKNIPNKMSDKDLVAFIAKVCPRRIDFVYLRMDFQNGCNVGYAFVNFITVQDLLCFAKKKLGEKWNMFSSEKVLQMSYATYQGKEALVEKFKNSCIMDEREAWRPKIFYSDPGPEQGLPELFPAPTHIRRKERSAYNRGALYVPGVGRESTPQFIAQSRRLDDVRKTSDHLHRQNTAEMTPGYSPSRRSINKLWGSSQHEKHS
ncbi:hypothetical protein C0991_001675 [Blastosporella zonata]|nr:hypothetical protein C0991_001675 [Blastosporella zonata]